MISLDTMHVWGGIIKNQPSFCLALRQFNLDTISEASSKFRRMRLHVSDIIWQLCLWKCHKAFAQSKRRKEGRETRREEPQQEQLNFLKHLLNASHEAKCFNERPPLILTTGTRYRFFTDWFFRWWKLTQRLRRLPNRFKQSCLFSELSTSTARQAPGQRAARPRVAACGGLGVSMCHCGRFRTAGRNCGSSKVMVHCLIHQPKKSGWTEKFLLPFLTTSASHNSYVMCGLCHWSIYCIKKGQFWVF